MNSNAKPAVVILARFSPRPGAKDCESSEVQIADGKRWAADNGLPIRSIHQDDAKSGFGADDERDGLQAALVSCKRGDVFLVRDFNRLSRDNHARLGYAMALAKRGVRLVSITEGEYRPEDKESKLLFGILAALGAYQRDCIRESTSSKMRTHQKNGHVMGGKPPYGQKFDENGPQRPFCPTCRKSQRGSGPCPKCGAETELRPTRWVEVPEQAKWIPAIVEWHGQGLSFHGICRRLEELKAPTTAKRWQVNTVKGILRRAGVELK